VHDMSPALYEPGPKIALWKTKNLNIFLPNYVFPLWNSDSSNITDLLSSFQWL